MPHLSAEYRQKDEQVRRQAKNETGDCISSSWHLFHQVSEAILAWESTGTWEFMKSIEVLFLVKLKTALVFVTLMSFGNVLWLDEWLEGILSKVKVVWDISNRPVWSDNHGCCWCTSQSDKYCGFLQFKTFLKKIKSLFNLPSTGSYERLLLICIKQ